MADNYYENTSSGSYDDKPSRSPKKDRHNDRHKVHFEVDDKINLKLDYDFAIALGRFLLDAEIEDKRFKSLGHHLMNLEGGE